MAYESVERFSSYWYQISSILILSPQDVLEIGVGCGLGKYIMSRAGVRVVTADIDGELGADYEADVRRLPFRDNQFDVVAAFQVLEHLPFSEFSAALLELRRVSRKFICISLPDGGRYSKLNIRLTDRIAFECVVDLSKIFKKKHVFDGQHYWEVNKTGYWPDVVRSRIRETKLEIVKELRLPQNMYRRIYILEK